MSALRRLGVEVSIDPLPTEMPDPIPFEKDQVHRAYDGEAAQRYPEPAGLPEAPVRPSGAWYDTGMREFILPYEAVRAASRPDDALLDFLQSTYEAAAELGGWDRSALDRPEGWDPHRR